MVERSIIKTACGLLPRKIENELQRAVLERGVLVLTGARQVGKTSIMYRLIDYLLNKEGVAESQIMYIDLEFPNILSQLNGLYGEDFLRFLRAHDIDTKKRAFVFIDEVHYLTNPSSFLKTVHDHYPQIKLIVSGSSTLKIKDKFADSLAGRKQMYEIFPLDFEEFLDFKGSNLSKRKEEFNIKRMIKSGLPPSLSEVQFIAAEFAGVFEEYVIFGGHPQVVKTESFEGKRRLLIEIYTSYIRKDIKDFAHIENISGFNRLIELLANQIGTPINISELSNSANISRPTVEKYLLLLENTFILSLLPPYYRNSRKEIIKSPKVFFHDCGARNAVIGNFEPLGSRMDTGMLFENAVFSELYKHRGLAEELHFWRTKSKVEADFVVKGKALVPCEVKYGLKKPKVTPGLGSFINAYAPPIAFVITRDFFAEAAVNETRVFFIPAWAL